MDDNNIIIVKSMYALLKLIINFVISAVDHDHSELNNICYFVL